MDQKLTIGMAHHNDFDGAYFTIQDIRKELLFNNRMDLLQKIEFVIIENDEKSKHAQAVQNLSKNGGLSPIRVINMDSVQGTSATRNKIIEEATGNFVMVMDCHVLLCPTVKVIEQLFTFIACNNTSDDLYCGPLVYDSMNNLSTHYNDTWGGQMWGQWGQAWQCVCESYNFSVTRNNKDCGYVSLSDQKKISACEYCENPFPKIGYGGHEGRLRKEGYSTIGFGSHDAPFEVFAQGLGLFLTRKNAWLKFNEHARGFGGEECVIHEKYRRAGRKTMCLPFLKWVHRFDRPEGVKYPLTAENKVRNYVLGFTEVGLDIAPLRKHFVDENNFPKAKWNELINEANILYNKSTSTTQPEEIMEQIQALQSQLSELKKKGKKCCKA